MSLKIWKVFFSISLFLIGPSALYSQTGADVLYDSDTIFNNGVDAARLTRAVVPFEAHIRNYFLSQEFEKSPNRLAYAIGGSLNWSPTLWENHLQARVTLATSQKIYAPIDKDGTMLLATGQESYSALSEYYLSGSFDKFTFNIGAMEYGNPLFNGADIRMTAVTHRGINANYRIDPDNYIGFAVFDAVKWINASSHENLYKYAGFDKNNVVYALGAKRKISNKSAGIYSSFAPNYYLGLYAEGYTLFKSKQNNYSLNLQYMLEKSIGSEIGGSFFFQMFGGKIDANFDKITAVLGYTYVASDDGPQQVWGVMPYYNMMIFSFFNKPREHALRIGAIKPILDNLKLIGNIGSGFTPNSGENASANSIEYNLTLDYTWKDIVNFRLRGAYYNELNSSAIIRTNDVYDFRFIVNYYWKSKP